MDATGKGALDLRVTNAVETKTAKFHLSIPLQVNYRANRCASTATRQSAVSVSTLMPSS
jgi:hypothetical protein